MADLFWLCWHFPDAAAEVLDQGVLDLVHAWERFNDLEPELPVPRFPAWLLIVRPRMVEWLPRLDDQQPEDYRLVHALQRGQSRGKQNDGETVRGRARLKELDPDLFRHYVQNL